MTSLVGGCACFKVQLPWPLPGWHGRYEFQRINHYPTAPRRSKIRARNKNAIPMRTIRPDPILKHCIHRRKMVTWLNNRIDGPGRVFKRFSVRTIRIQLQSRLFLSFLDKRIRFGSPISETLRGLSRWDCTCAVLAACNFIRPRFATTLVLTGGASRSNQHAS